MAKIFKNVSIASEDRADLIKADVKVENGKIVQIQSGIESSGADEIFDGEGSIMLPGLFDLHVHAREPGYEQKENIQSCSEAAINGGVTGFVMMPNTNPTIDTAGVVRSVLESASKCRIPIYTAGAITNGRGGKELASIGAMKAAGAVMITDDGSSVSNPVVLRRAMEYAKEFGLMVASHCEVPELSGKGVMHEGSVSYSLGLEGVPAISEEICIDRDIRIGHFTGAHVHIQNVSTALGMNAIRKYKEEGIKVTCEVSPHHLIFTHEDIQDYDTNFKMSPPLRTREDTEALVQGLKDGVFDVIATDHAPHTEIEKRNDFTTAPFGITGLETALPSLYHYFIRKEIFGWNVLVKHFSAEPRRLLNLAPVPVVEGGQANFVLFNPSKSTTFSREFFKSKSLNTPFLGKTLQGSVEFVVLGDEILLRR